MTKKELNNLHQLLCSSTTFKLALKIIEAHELTDEQLIKLLWCKMRPSNYILEFGKLKMIRLFTNDEHCWKLEYHNTQNYPICYYLNNERVFKIVIKWLRHGRLHSIAKMK